MTYVDGYLLAVKTDRKDDYLSMAKDVAPIFKDHGAIKVVECWGDDVPDGKLTSFPMAVKRQDDETVVFSWILWPSKEVRDKGLKSAMEDPRMKQPDAMPFDGKRMIFGGFEMVLEA